MSEIVENPEWVSSSDQVGNKIWRLVPGDGVSITKETSSSVDTYTFDAKVSEEKGNILRSDESGGLYVPELTSISEELQKEIDKLKEDLAVLKDMEYRSSNSVKMTKSIDSDGKVVVKSDIKISIDEGNILEARSDGMYVRATDYGPGSIMDIERRLTALENELASINQDIDNLKTTACINKSGEITPPIVIPD